MSTFPTVSGTSCEFEHNYGYFPDDVKTDDEFQSVRGESDFDDEFHHRSLDDYEINEYYITNYKAIENQNPFKLYNSALAVIKEDDSEFQYIMRYKLIFALQNYIIYKINENIYSYNTIESLYYVNSNCSLITFNKEDVIIGHFQIVSSISYLDGMIIRYNYVDDAFQLVNNHEYFNTCNHSDTEDDCEICNKIISIPFAPFAYIPNVTIELEKIKDDIDDIDYDEENDKKSIEEDDDYSVYELDSVC